MGRISLLLLSILSLVLLIGATASENEYGLNWPQWRGPEATGVAPFSDPPVEWSESKNIRWKVAIAGKGKSTPIVWGDRIFLVSAVETETPEDAKAEEPPAEQPAAEGQQARRRRSRGVQPGGPIQFAVLAIDRQNGKTIWKKIAREETPHEGTHTDGSWAANSPITDGEHVFAYFGSRGLYCYDMEGNLQWQKDFGNMTTRNGFGEGSSPALHGDVLVVNWDHEGPSFIVALNKNTGEELWRKDRDEVTSWSTPLIIEKDGRAQVIVNATKKIMSYDLKTGDVIWESSGMTVNTIPSPVFGDGLVYLMSGFRGNALQAIRLAAASGDISGTEAIVWQYDKDTPYVPSPLLYGDALYFIKTNSSILSCFNAKTGEPFYSRQRLEGISGIYASPVGAKDRVYFAGRDGTTLVIKHGPEYEVLATNTLDDGFDASPAIVGNEILLRGKNFLYSIAAE